MGKYRKKVSCPLDKTKLGWEELVETRVGEVYTYHCGHCNTYWHVQWFKHYKSIGSKTWKWNVSSIYDDFGKKFDFVFLA